MPEDKLNTGETENNPSETPEWLSKDDLVLFFRKKFNREFSERTIREHIKNTVSGEEDEIRKIAVEGAPRPIKHYSSKVREKITLSIEENLGPVDSISHNKLAESLDISPIVLRNICEIYGEKYPSLNTADKRFFSGEEQTIIRECLNENFIPKDYVAKSALQKVLKIKPSRMDEMAAEYAKDHPEWIKYSKVHQGQCYYSPELEKLFLNYKKETSIPKGFISFTEFRHIFEIHQRQIDKILAPYQEKYPEYFKEIKDSELNSRFCISKKLIKIFEQEYKKFKAPEGYLTATTIAKRLDTAWQVVKKIIADLQQESPEKFLTNEYADYYSPEIFEIIADRVTERKEKLTVPDGYLTEFDLVSKYGTTRPIAKSTIEQIWAEENNPDQYISTGHRKDKENKYVIYYSPAFQEKFEEKLKARKALIPPEGYLSAFEISRKIGGVGIGTINNVVQGITEEHSAEIFMGKRSRIADNKIFQYFSPAAQQIILERLQKNLGLSTERLKRSMINNFFKNRVSDAIDDTQKKNLDENLSNNIAETDHIHQYFADIGKKDLLTRAEEADFFRLIKRGNKEAREEFIELNLPLVISIARSCRQSDEQFMDLIMEGNIGLIEAVSGFDYKRGNKFSTYATWQIKKRISEFLMKYSRNVRLPSNKIQELYTYKKAKNKLTRRFHRAPYPDEIADDLCVEVEKVLDWENLSQKGESHIDKPISDEDGTIGDLIENKNSTNPEEEFHQNNLPELIEELIEILDEREREIIKMRFGYYGDKITLEEAGKKLNISQERVRQLEGIALEKLKKEMQKRKKTMEDYI